MKNTSSLLFLLELFSPSFRLLSLTFWVILKATLTQSRILKPSFPFIYLHKSSDFLEIIIRFLNPTTPLTASIEDLSKQVFCAKACVHYYSINTTLSHNYTDYPQCMELFNGNITEEIGDYCPSVKDFNWLSHLKAAIIAGFAYLILLFLLSLVKLSPE